MEISKETFFSAGLKSGASQEQLMHFWNQLEQSEEPSSFSRYLFYLGALVVISAMTWFMGYGLTQWGSGAVLGIAVTYMAVFIGFGAGCWNKKGLRIPAGLLITLAVCMVPLAIYCLEDLFHVWPKGNPGKYQDFYSRIQGSWFFMELGTIFAGIVALRFFPFPFITAPIFFSCWYLAMDLVPLIYGQEATVEQQSWISIALGLLLLVIGFVTDRWKKQEYGFWSYFFGTVIFWGGLSFITFDKGEWGFFIYLLINVSMMFFSILVRRKVLLVFGALGSAIYLGHLAYDLFKDSFLFPFVLTIIGLSIIYGGVLYQKHRNWIQQKIPLKIRSFFNNES